MKASELRIGNWVDAETENYNVRSGCYSINSINLRGMNKDNEEQYLCHLLAPDRTTFIIVKDENILPIPITEEWLLKFGFIDYRTLPHKTTKRPYYDIEIGCYLRGWNPNLKHSKLRLLFIEGDHFHNVISPGNGSVWVSYVHQLQNLYFALTGEELKMQ